MSKKTNSNNSSNSKINNNNNNFSQNSSFINSKLEINPQEKDNSFKDLTQIDKFIFIQNCMKKASQRDQEEYMEINDLKLNEKALLAKINELKADINETTRNIDEIKIAREDIDRKLKNKKVFLENRMGKTIDDNNKKTMEEINRINEDLENDILDINNEMEMIKKDIEFMSKKSIETHQNIDLLKKKCEDLIKNNISTEKRIIKKEKELKKITLDTTKIENKIYNQDLNSQIFLKQIEKWANKKSSIKNNNDILDRPQEEKEDQ